MSKAIGVLFSVAGGGCDLDKSEWLKILTSNVFYCSSLRFSMFYWIMKLSYTMHSIIGSYEINLNCVGLRLRSLSTIFQFIDGGNRRKPPTCHKSLTNLSHNVVTITPRIL